ncbi:UNVERIFIED_CONTAM: Ras- protein Rab-12 [Gekko kuhli]
MEPGAGLQRRGLGGGGGLGSGGGSPALSGPQARRRKQPPRPADFKLQVIIIGSRGVGKTSLMERFTDDTFCEACKSTVVLAIAVWAENVSKNTPTLSCVSLERTSS